MYARTRQRMSDFGVFLVILLFVAMFVVLAHAASGCGQAVAAAQQRNSGSYVRPDGVVVSESRITIVPK